MKIKNLIYTFVSFSLLYSCNIKEQSEIQKEVIASGEIIEIDADSLINGFATDSAGSVNKFMDKVLLVSGEVAIFEQLDTIDFHPNDSLPFVVKWFINRVESDINTSNIFLKRSEKSKNTKDLYALTATFPREYRKELVGIKENSKIKIKGKLEHISTISETLADSTKKPISYILSLQGCVVE